MAYQHGGLRKETFVALYVCEDDYLAVGAEAGR
jgi:hypothetical protein